MARLVATDFLHSMRFHVTVTDFAGNDPTARAQALVGTQAGFSSCTTPELSSEAVEYKEGHFLYARKYPGNPSVSDVTLSRGVARGDSSFWTWMRSGVEGGDVSYRADLEIKHFHRDTAFAVAIPVTGKTDLDVDVPARTYVCLESFPIRHKVASDLDATASEISVMEIDVAMERFYVIEAAVSV